MDTIGERNILHYKIIVKGNNFLKDIILFYIVTTECIKKIRKLPESFLKNYYFS